MNNNHNPTTGGGRVVLLLGTLHNGGAGDDTEPGSARRQRRSESDSIRGARNRKYNGHGHSVRAARNRSVFARNTVRRYKCYNVLTNGDKHNIKRCHKVYTFGRRDDAERQAPVFRRLRHRVFSARLIIAGVSA